MGNSRILKFRAWIGKRQMIFSGDTYGAYLDFFEKCRDAHDGYGGCFLMQFTGLLDKNGKEIYEGDICQCEIADDYELEYRVEKVTITFAYGAFCPIFMAYREFCDFDDKPLRYRKFEIIGNIHENPELLRNP